MVASLCSRGGTGLLHEHKHGHRENHCTEVLGVGEEDEVAGEGGAWPPWPVSLQMCRLLKMIGKER